jgi:integrase
VTFTPKERNQLKNQLPAAGKGSVVAQETVIDHELLRSLLKHLDTMSKAAVLCMATGGMRIGELLRVKCTDVDLKSNPARIKIHAMVKTGDEFSQTKTKKGRYTFVTPETVDALREWIKVRGAYLENASKKGHNFKSKKATVSIHDDRLFPCSDQTINEAITDAVTKVNGTNEVCPITGRSLIHSHGLRKFFVSQLSFATSLDFADFLAGHINTITETYCKLGPEQLGERYKDGMHRLYIEVPEEIRDVVTMAAKIEQDNKIDREEREKDREEAQKIRNQTTDATNKLTLYMAENAELKLRMEQMEEENNKKIAALQENVADLVALVTKALDGEDVQLAHGKMSAARILKQKPGKRE